MADSGIYATDYLRSLKDEHRSPRRIAYPWPWEPENVAFVLGGNILFGPRPVLAVDAAEVLAARRDILLPGESPSIVFDLHLRSTDGADVARMDGNLFEAFTPDLRDFLFTPGANAFHIEHTSGVELGLEFRRYGQAGFLRKAQTVLEDTAVAAQALHAAARFSTDSDGMIPVVSITGSVLTTNVALRIRARAVEMVMHCYGNEEVAMRGHVFEPEGVLRVCVGDSEVLRFG
jgi:hypothetical protein